MDIDFGEHLIIETLAQWNKDIIKCSTILQRILDLSKTDYDPFNMTLLECEQLYMHGIPEKDLETILNYIKCKCFTKLDYYFKLMISVCDAPDRVFDMVWNECLKNCSVWNDYFVDAYNYIKEGLKI